jgi:positive regulator of sigma E activity
MKQENKLKVKAVVTKVYDGKIDVEVSRHSACEKCGSCLGAKEKILRLPTNLEVHEGDTVYLEICCSIITKVSFLLYFLPAVSAITGFIAGYLWKGNLGGFAGAVILIAINYLIIKKVSDKKYKHTIQVSKI